MEEGEVVAVRDLAEWVELLVSGFDPAGRTESTMVASWQACAGPQIVVKDSAVVDNAGDDFDVVLDGCVETKPAGPVLERVEDDHCPIDDGAVVVIVADGADQTVGIPVEIGERASKQLVGLTLTVNVGGHKSANAFFVSVAYERFEAIRADICAEVHKMAATPDAESGRCRLHHSLLQG